MSDSIKMIAVLTIVGLSSGGLLTGVYQMTSPQIGKEAQESLRKAIFIVLPKATDYEKVIIGEDVLYQGINKKGKKVGWAFLASGNGFQGKIKVMVGTNQKLNKLQNIEVLESIETPGLGGRITEDEFKRQFSGLSVKKEIKLVKVAKPKGVDASTRGTVQAITGATISSKAIVEIIQYRVAAIRKLLKEQK